MHKQVRDIVITSADRIVIFKQLLIVIFLVILFLFVNLLNFILAIDAVNKSNKDIKSK